MLNGIEGKTSAGAYQPITVGCPGLAQSHCCGLIVHDYFYALVNVVQGLI